MNTQDLSLNSFFSTDKKNYDEFIENSNNFAFENINFDISFIENIDFIGINFIHCSEPFLILVSKILSIFRENLKILI